MTWRSIYSVNYCFIAVPTKITRSDAVLLSPTVARFSCHVTSDPGTCAHVTWSRGGQAVLPVGHRVFLEPNRSLVVNVTGDPEGVARSALGAVYMCNVTNGMTSDWRQVRLDYDVIGSISDWPMSLPWMSLSSVTGMSLTLDQLSCHVQDQQSPRGTIVGPKLILFKNISIFFSMATKVTVDKY